MREQIFGASGSREKSPGRDVIVKAEKDLIKYLTGCCNHFAWESWKRGDVEGFRTTTANGFEITIRQFHGCIYGRGNHRWNKYGFNPEAVPHFYHIEMRDPLNRHGRKYVTDYAAPPKDGGYRLLHTFFKRVRAHALRHPTPLISGFVPEKLPGLAIHCIAESPFRKTA